MRTTGFRMESNYFLLMMLHMWTVLVAFLLGTIVLLMKKGTSIHKRLGWIYMVLMFFTAAVSVFLEARVGPQFLGHFGWIHLLSLLTLYTVPSSIIHVRKKRIKAHRRGMLILYFAGIIVAGIFTFAPGRYLHDLFFGG